MQRTFKRFLSAALIAVSLVSLTGCGPSAGSADRMEERDPLFRRALARKNVEDIDGAIEFFNKALDRKPQLARAHLELGLLYDMKKQDYVRAIYHYERYLEMRPEAEKRDLIEGLILQGRLSFAASLPNPPPGAVQEIAMLKREISVLKNQLEGAVVSAPAAPAAKPAAKPAPASAATAASAAVAQMPVPKPAPAQPAMEPYVVLQGDTLSRIAAKVYKDSSKWKQIYDANRDVLSRAEDVKVGQTLRIPR